MMSRRWIVSGVLACSLLGGAARAQVLSIDGLFAPGAPMDRSQIKLPGHNRYMPYAGIEDPAQGKVYSSGFYSSAARSQDRHGRYDY